MSELLEIDFIQEFGALSSKVRNSNSFCKEMSEENHPSTEDFESSLNAPSNIRDTSETEPFPKNTKSHIKRLRLTSIDD